MVGSAFKNVESHHKIRLVGTNDCDLTDQVETNNLFRIEKPDAIIHLAARVGGVKGNSDYVADFFCENIKINTNVLEAAKNHSISRVVSLLSTCIYPDKVTYPLTENKIHEGEPHESNFGYAYAKRMLEVHSRAIRRQYGLKYISAVPNNIYGPNDNFDLEKGHVVPAIIRKLQENNNPTLWGDGSALREFTYAGDIARALLLLLENYEGEKPINIGNTHEVSIKELARKIAFYFPNIRQVKWDISKPKGQYKKPSSNKNFVEMFPGFRYTSLDDGLKYTVEWFKDKYPNVRGVK